MNQPNTTAWSKAVCTATSNFFTCRTPCSCGWKTPCFSCNTDHLNIAFSNMFPDTGLAQGQTCQSGVWRELEGYPIGSPIPWPSVTPPPGYFLMAGQRFPCGSYPGLARVYPGCVLPDLRGTFIRGWDNGRGFDNGRTILSYQADQSDMIYNPGGHLQGHHSGMAHYYHTDTREVRPKNIAFNYIVKAG